MTMQEQKQKSKKSYSELLADIKKIFSQTAAVYIPQLCEALKEEQPDYTNGEIQRTIERDLEGINTPLTIYQYLPTWMRDEKASQGSYKSWETRNANKLKKAKENFALITSNPIAEPPAQKEEDEDIEFGDKELMTFGKEGKTILRQVGDVTHGCGVLFEALTGIDHLPHNDEDLTLDYVKPTRDKRKSIIEESDEAMHKTLWNSL